MGSTIQEALCEAYRTLENTWNNSICKDLIFISARDADNQSIAIPKKYVQKEKRTSEDVLLLDAAGRVMAGEEAEIDERFFTHKVLYQVYPYIKGIVQLNTRWCSIWSQIGNALPPLSPLHAKSFFGEIPCTDAISMRSCGQKGDPIKNICTLMGEAVIDALGNRVASQIQAAFIRNMGAITWGSSVEEAVVNALTLEEDSFQAYHVGLAVKQNYQYMPYHLSKEIFFRQPDHISFTQTVEKRKFSE